MKPLLIVVVAGIPSQIGNEVVGKLRSGLPSTTIVSWLPLDLSRTYTEPYAERLYERFASKLRQRQQCKKPNVLSDANLVLLYLDKGDATELALFGYFGVEALVLPLALPDIDKLPLLTGNQRRRVANLFDKEGQRAIHRARQLLTVVAEEVTNRDNKSCLLLPCRNFGSQISNVLDCVRSAARLGKESDRFKADIGRVSHRISTSREGTNWYFKGRGGIVFKSPGKAYGRHGLAPRWDASGHELSCVIRGRVRFGVSYDPKFHYDCAITKEAGRRFPSCHREETIPRGRAHVNIAPNDNIR